MAAATLTAGAIFGIGLTASGVHLPYIVAGQMRLEQLHMLKVFLSASATSTFIIAVALKNGFPLQPRTPASQGWFSRHDGNLVGGGLIGVGMALTGACPGTIFAQVGAGVKSSYSALLGSVLGGIIYVKIAPLIKRPVQADPDKPIQLTLQDKLKLNRDIFFLLFEGLVIAIVTVASQLQASPSKLLPPALGGLSVGLGQAAALLLMNQTIGTSGSFEEVGQWTWRVVDKVRGKAVKPNPPGYKSLTFVTGIVLGSFLLSQKYPIFNATDVDMNISALRGVVGGALMIIGSRIAGGCTSGHGISGLSLFSVSSLYSVAAMFGGGIVFGLALKQFGY